MVIASYGQTLKHLVQPVQATLQFFLAIPPLSSFMHDTNIFLSFLFFFLSSMIFLGQALTQAPQAVQLSSMTTGRPVFSSMYMASNLQALTQSPRPRQPYEHPVSPSYKLAATAQDEAPL